MEEKKLNFSDCKILIVGDVMLDKYYFGTVERISPEAPVPIVNITKEESRLGGAANVANNIASLGGHPLLCGTVGHDFQGRELERISKQKQISTLLLHTVNPTITKATPSPTKTKKYCKKKSAGNSRNAIYSSFLIMAKG